jgi:hypothetical protein
MKKLAILTIALAMIVGSLFAAPKEKKPPVVIFDPATTAVDAGEVVTIDGEKYLKIKPDGYGTQFNIPEVDLNGYKNFIAVMFADNEVKKYNITVKELMEQLKWINDMGDCYVRVIHETRKKSQYTEGTKNNFIFWCNTLKSQFPNIQFWCGRNLYNWEVDYNFNKEPTCEEKYSSVRKPKLIDDWCPYIYAKLNNKEIIKTGTNKDILLIDYVNIGNDK